MTNLEIATALRNLADQLAPGPAGSSTAPLSEQLEANRKARMVDAAGFRAGIAKFGPFSGFSIIAQRDNDVRVAAANGNHLGEALFAKSGPFSRAGMDVSIQAISGWLAGHKHTMGQTAADEAGLANEPDPFPEGSSPVDHQAEIEGIIGSDPTDLTKRINLKLGTPSMDYTFREDGRIG